MNPFGHKCDLNNLGAIENPLKSAPIAFNRNSPPVALTWAKPTV